MSLSDFENLLERFTTKIKKTRELEKKLELEKNGKTSLNEQLEFNISPFLKLAIEYN